MYPRIKFKYENHTTGEHLTFTKGEQLIQKLKELKTTQKYKVKFKFENYRPDKKTIDVSFKEKGFKIKIIGEQLIKKIENDSQTKH